MRAVVFGGPPPTDRRFFELSLDLLHAARTGDFPYGGGLAEQPARLRNAYRLALAAVLHAERVQRGAVLPSAGAKAPITDRIVGPPGRSYSA